MNLSCHYAHSDHRTGQFTFDGFPRGTARSTGNALRRALLSEIEGAAVTAVRIHGVQHVLDAPKGVKEDVPEIVANLRQLEVRLHTAKGKWLKIHTEQRHVTGLDIEPDDDVEILNPQQPIATLSPGARLEMQIAVRNAKGSAECGMRSAEKDLVPERSSPHSLHSTFDIRHPSFCPVKQVGYRIETLGEDDERLVMHVTSNGTISPRDAMSQAMERLIGYLESLRMTGEFNGSNGTFRLDADALAVLGHALKWELLSYERDGTQPVLTTVLSRAEIRIGTDGSLAPKEALEACVGQLRDRLGSVKMALQNATVERTPLESNELPRSGDPIVFGDLSFVEETPDLLAIQRNSFHQLLDSGIAEVLAEMFPVCSDDGKAQLELLDYRLTTPMDVEECVRLGKTYAASLVLSLRISVPDRAETQEFQLDVGEIPLMAEDGSFIIQGVRRVVVSQLHRSPGVTFTRSEKEGKLVGSIVPYRGAWIEFEIPDGTDGPEGIFAKLDRRKRIAATCLLRALGVETDEQIASLFADAQGSELIQRTLQLDTTTNKDEALLEIYARLGPGETPDIAQATSRFELMLAYPARYDLSRVGRHQLNRKLGLEISEEEHLVTLEDVVAVMRRLLAVYSGQERPDDIASLEERRVRSVGELVQNALRVGFARMARHARQELCLLSQANTKLAPTELVEPKFIADVLSDFWENSDLVQVVSQINPLDDLTHKRRLSLMGPGGQDRDQTPFEMRAVHETHHGRICPIETPEGPNVGLIVTLANQARVNEYGFIEPGNTQHGSRILGLSSSLIPLIEYDDTNRALMGANMQRQAIPLLSAEAPLVQSGMERKAARDSHAMCHARKGGQVVRVTADGIAIKADDNTLETYHLTRHRRSNQGTIIHQKPTVTLGQTVRVGDPIADGPATKNGILALGRNVLMAYMPWEGYNYEDAMVFSDRLLKEEIFTSVHIETIRVEAHQTQPGLERLTRYLPGRADEDANHLDERGIAKIGTWVHPGDVLVGKLSPRSTDDPSLMNLLEEEPIQYTDTSSVVPAHIKGQVIRTQYLSRRQGDALSAGVEEAVTVEIAVHREVQVGDKFANRHGNKGVVGKIVPEADMPHLADGTPVDVLLNPLGAFRRGNNGQILETQLGWAAHQLGQTVISSPYAGPSNEQIKALLSRAGLPENGMTTLFDGRTGRAYEGEVLVGYQYLMKLIHLVEDKIHARSIGPYSIVTQQPLGGKTHNGGQRFGEMELWALEAYGAAHTLHEMLTLKSNAAVGLELYKRLANGTSPELREAVQEGRRAGVREFLNPSTPEPLNPYPPHLLPFVSCLRGLGIDLTQDEEGMHIRLASPEQRREWSQGEVHIEMRGEEANEAEDYSLVELPDPHAMGHIELATPVSHVWFLKGMPSRIGTLLDISYRELEGVLYFETYIVLDSGDSPHKPRTLLSKEEYSQERERPGFRAGIGGDAIYELLQRLDLKATAQELTSANQETQDAAEKKRLRKRFQLIRELQESGIRPEWLMLTVLPVVPSGMRPMVRVSEEPDATAMSAASDLNTLYRQVIHRNNRLKRLIDLNAPETVIHNEARSLQEAVDTLLDNGRHGRITRDEDGHPLQSLSDMLKGKPGLPRNLLGVRADYSGRSVITPGPELRLDECGLPKEMALRLFEPFILHALMRAGHAGSIRAAKRLVDEHRPEAVTALEKVATEHLVLLNRAPTLHRACLQAFKPVLIDDKAIRLHPLMCPAFNADFDGDQMAVHVPITEQAQKEAQELLLSPHNVISLANGRLMAQPMHEISLGCQYLTLAPASDIPEVSAVMTPEEIQRAYELDRVGLHAKLTVKWEDQEIATTVGRVIFNMALAGRLPYVNETVDSSHLLTIIESVHETQEEAETALLLDRLMMVGLQIANCGVRSVDSRLQSTEHALEDPQSPIPNPQSPDAHFTAAQVGRKQLYDIVMRTESVVSLSRKLATVAANGVITEQDCGTERSRNSVNCETTHGICATCYGTDPATEQPVALGTPVGMLAVSALGEHIFQFPLESVHRLSELLEAGTPLLVNGHPYPFPELLREQGMDGLHNYVLEALQAVYREQGIEIFAKHLEVFIRQMLSLVQIVDPGGTRFLEEEQVSRTRLAEENATVIANGGQPATWEPLVIGITKVALANDSFLSAAAFQQVTDVLTKAALSGATDPLRGIHECVIAGKLIPVGTGFPSA